jgi:hypothetical protein
MSPYQILEHYREDLRRTLRSEGCAENEIEACVERSLAHWVACSLSSAMSCAEVAEQHYFRDRPEVSRQIWNWN